MKHFSVALGALAFVLSAQPVLAEAPHAMNIEDLLTLKRVAAPVASPDGQWVVWQQTDTDPASYKRTPGLWRVSAKGGMAQRIADLPDAGETSPAFSPDGKRLYFISGKSGSDQLWLLDLTTPGTAPVQASAFKSDVAGFQISPDGKRMLVWGDVARQCPTLGCETSGDTSQPGPGSGRLYKDGAGFVRHWDAWETPGNYSRGFVLDLGADGKLGSSAVALDGPAGTLTGDTPTKPMGGAEELAWAADSQSVFFVARQADRNEPTSTDTNVWHSLLDGKAPHSPTLGNKGSDTLPAPSPDGQWLACAARTSSGTDIYAMPVAGGAAVQLTTMGFARAPAFSPDGHMLAFLATTAGSNSFDLWVADVQTDAAGTLRLDEPRQLTTDMHLDADSGVAWGANEPE